MLFIIVPPLVVVDILCWYPPAINGMSSLSTVPWPRLVGSSKNATAVHTVPTLPLQRTEVPREGWGQGTAPEPVHQWGTVPLVATLHRTAVDITGYNHGNQSYQMSYKPYNHG